MTIGLKNCRSELLSNLIKWFWSISLFNSLSPRFCRCTGIRRPFSCIGTKSWLNWVLIIWFFDFPIRMHSFWKLSLTHCVRLTQFVFVFLRSTWHLFVVVCCVILCWLSGHPQGKTELMIKWLLAIFLSGLLFHHCSMPYFWQCRPLGCIWIMLIYRFVVYAVRFFHLEKTWAAQIGNCEYFFWI